jgi:xylan 1,4-beta-xylosidase
MIYHGYENGFRTLGRQTLLEPVEWTADGWPLARGGDLSAPLPKPEGGQAVGHGIALADVFADLALGTRWVFFGAGPDERRRATIEGQSLLLAGKGARPGDSSPLVQTAGDLAYEISVSMELEGQVEGGLPLFYNDRLFIGMGHDGKRMNSYRGGKSSYWREPAPETRSLHLKIRNDHTLTLSTASTGRTGPATACAARSRAITRTRSTTCRPEARALFAAGEGRVRFRDYRYRALT